MVASANTAYWICAQTGVNPLAIGMPGIAKSQTIHAFARAAVAQGQSELTSQRNKEIARLRDKEGLGPGEKQLPDFRQL